MPDHEVRGVNDLAWIADSLRERSSVDFDTAVWRAARGGPEGERLLIEALDRGGVTVVASLGDATGNAAIEPLRTVLHTTGPGRRDLRCAAALALAKRLGASCTDDMIVALADRDSAVRTYALIGLAGAGNGSAWDPVVAELARLLRRQRKPNPAAFSPPRSAVDGGAVCVALAYLGQHAVDNERLDEIRATVARRWVRIQTPERVFVGHYLPAFHPDADDPRLAHDAARLRAWARHPLLDPLPDLFASE